MKQVSRSELINKNAIQAEIIDILSTALKEIADMDSENLPVVLAEVKKHDSHWDAYPAMTGFAKATAKHALERACKVK